MKPAAAPKTEPERPARADFRVRFSLGSKGRRRVFEAPSGAAPEKGIDSAPEPEIVAPPERVPKIALLLVLGHHFERRVRDGVVKDYSEIARLTGVTRARVTQIVNLTLLAPEIQDALLRLPGGSGITERNLRPLTCCADWRTQRTLWKFLGGRLTNRPTAPVRDHQDGHVRR
jgi:hypothetical protein